MEGGVGASGDEGRVFEKWALVRDDPPSLGDRETIIYT